MTKETLLVKTKDNNVIVVSITYGNAAEKARLIKQCEQYCRSVNYKDFNESNINSPGIVFDSSNTVFLKREIFGYPHKRCPENFENEMKDNNFPPKVRKPNVLHFDTRLPDDFFPKMIRNTGYKIKSQDEIYQVRFNAKNNKYEVVGFNYTRAQVSHESKEITIVRNHYEFAPGVYAKLQSLIADFKASQKKNPKLSMKDYARSIKNPADRSLFNIYSKERNNINHLDSIISHELKHIKNFIFINGMKLKDDYKRLDADNMYRLCVENERSSYLEQLIYCINTYLKRGNYNDFSMFDGESKWCAQELKALRTKEERIAFLRNQSLLVEKSLSQFSTIHKKTYDENQFKNNLKYMVENEPLSVPPDTDGKMFRRLRSLFYHYMIYNPETGKEESVNLSKYITPALEVKISKENHDNLVKPTEDSLQEDLAEFIKNRDNNLINIDLVAPAKALIRGAIYSASCINEIDGMNIGSLPEERKSEHKEVKTVPTDKAYWSDELQKYWSKVDGYNELAKNNSEYTFKINDAKISYSDKNHVNISQNADFELYVKLLKEPSSKNNVIEFAPSLTKEQTLMLYIACTNYGRKMSGNVPTDLSGISKLHGIPAAEINKFNHRVGGGKYSSRTIVADVKSVGSSRLEKGGR